MLATSPVATGEAKIEGPPQGDGNVVVVEDIPEYFVNLRTRTPQGDGAYPPASPIEMVVMNMYERPSKIAVHIVLP